MMSQSNSVKEYFEKYLKELSIQLKLAMDSQEVNAVHQSRVNAKRLNALILFFDQKKQEDQFKTLYKPIRKIFKRAGRIREIQLELDRLQQLSIELKDIQDQLQIDLKDSIYEFLKLEKNWENDLTDFSRSFGNHLVPVSFDELDSYFVKLLHEIQGLLLLGRYHDARKKIKSIIYLKELLPPKKQKELEIDFAFLEELQEKIGIWHDLITASHFRDSSIIIPQQENRILELEAYLNSIKSRFLKTAYFKGSSFKRIN